MAAPATPVRRPRWGHRTTLFQVHQPAFWFFVVVTLAALIFLMVRFFAPASEVIPGQSWVLSVALLVLFGAPLMALIYVLDLYEREPLSLVVGALLWGGIAATALAGMANSQWIEVIARLGGAQFAAEWAAALVAPVTEETLKALGVVLVYLIARGEMDDMIDGFVYGAASGLGFALVENVMYFMTHFGGTTGGILDGFYVRVIAGGIYGHVLWTAMTGMAIAYFVTRRGEATLAKRLGVAAALWVLAIVGHFVWNSPFAQGIIADLELPLDGIEYAQVLLFTAIRGVPLLVFVIILVLLARRRENRWLMAALQSEVGREGILEEEVPYLATPAGRRRARSEVRTRGGTRWVRVLRRLHRGQINLAMIRTRVEEDEHPDLAAQRGYCRSIRDSLSGHRMWPPSAARHV